MKGVYQDGNSDGYLLAMMAIDEETPTRDREKYLEGYKQGIFELSKEAEKAGYEQAFVKIDADVPTKFGEPTDGGFHASAYFYDMDDDEYEEGLDKLDIDTWQPTDSFYKGFHSNKVAANIREDAKWDGYFFSDRQTLEQGQKVYDQIFDQKQFVSIILLSSIIGGSFLILGIAVYRDIIRKKKS